MGDGHETESAVERLPTRWRYWADYHRRNGSTDHAATLDYCARELTKALKEDGVIPTRMKRS